MKLSPDFERPSRILIVDDELHNRQLLEVMLAPEGFHVRLAGSGQEALAMVARQPPDLILLDVMMPGMDGYQVAGKIKGDPSTRQIPIIIVTALNQPQEKLLGLRAGAEDFLSKPVDRAELCVRVRNLLRLKAYGDKLAKYSEGLEAEVASRTAELVERTTSLLKLTEQEERRKDQLRFKDEFLSHVSHELRSPLTAIKQFTTILLGGLAGELSKEQLEYLEIVLKNIQQLQAMIDDLLEVSRLETAKLTLELERVSLPDAVTDTFNTLQLTARAKAVTLACDLSPDLPAAYADRTRLRQILIILLDNAVKFSSDGGAITLRARVLQEDPQFLIIDVSDTGCGMSLETAERIFERLYQVPGPAWASRRGLGLGLHICKELVTRQGGQIWVKSRPDKGSTFSFTVPVFPLHSVFAESARPHIIPEGV